MQPQTLRYYPRLSSFTCVLPSCRSRWPGIIHPALHTPSPPTPWCQKQTKQKKIAERQGSDEISDSWSVFKHQKRRSGFCSSGLSCPLVTTTLSQQRRGCEASEPTASSLRSAQTKRNVLFDGTGSCCSPRRRRRYSPLGRTGGMEQGRALAGRTTAGKRGGHMHRGSSWSPR